MPFSSAYSLPRLASSPIASALLAALLGTTLGVAFVSRPSLVVLLIGGVAGLLAVAVAYAHPGRVLIGLILLMALVPTYAAPSIGPLLFHPAAAAGWLLAGGLAWRNVIRDGQIFRPTFLDYALGAFVLLMGISVSFSARIELTDFLRLMFLWMGPLLAARLLLRETPRPAATVALGFALAMAVLAPIAVLEVLGVENPFFNLNFNATEFAVWGQSAERFGQVRAEASFGHPIAFSMFATATALLAAAMAAGSSDGRRSAWFAVAAVSVGIQSLALSRTGWLMLALGVVMIAIVTVRGETRYRIAVIAVITGTVILMTSIVWPQGVQVLPGFSPAGEGDDSFQSSGTYREALLSRATEPGVLGLWGNPVNRITPAVEGGTATDNAYIILADAWGLIPTFALLLIAFSLLAVLVPAYRRRIGAVSGLPIAAFAGMAALFFVAFITQQQLMIWLLIGSTAAAAERIWRRDADGDADAVQSSAEIPGRR